jgi:putative membrane protein
MPKTPLMLIAAALAASLGPARALAQPPAPQPPKPQTPAPMSTKDFLQAAAGSDQFEITEAQTALVQSRNPQVRAFAQEMIRDHEADAQALTRAATSSGLKPPTMSMSGDQSKLLSGLQGLTSRDFDKDYAKQQVLAHTEALVIVGGYADGGSDANVRHAATTAVPMIQHHLEMAQQLKASLGAG